IVASADDAFRLDDEARIVWQDEAIAVVVGGSAPLRPQIEIPADERIDAADRIRLEARLRAWMTQHIDRLLEPLAKARQDAAPPAVRGILFHLTETLGVVSRAVVEQQLKALGPED